MLVPEEGAFVTEIAPVKIARFGRIRSGFEIEKELELERVREIASGKICRYVALIASIIGTVVFALSFTMLVIYLALDPDPPRMEILRADVLWYDVEPMNEDAIAAEVASGKGNYHSHVLSFNTSFMLYVINPNKHCDLIQERILIEMLYFGRHLSSSEIFTLFQPRRTATQLQIFLTADRLPLTRDVADSMLKLFRRSNFNFVVDFVMFARMSTVGRLQSPIFFVRVRCEVFGKNSTYQSSLCLSRNA